MGGGDIMIAISEQLSNGALIVIMGATVTVVYKLLGLALPRIGRSVMGEEIAKAIKESNDQHDREHERMWRAIEEDGRRH